MLEHTKYEIYRQRDLLKVTCQTRKIYIIKRENVFISIQISEILRVDMLFLKSSL